MSAMMTTLPNGLRVVTDTVESVDSVAIGIWADVGTRHEEAARSGVAHLVEHMVFKGTGRRSVTDIAEAIENKGGHMNAYTGREMTAFHIHLLKEDVDLAFDILSDMLTDPLFDEADLGRERDVILQEIGMSNDTPDDLVYDYFQTQAYPGQMLGAPILGAPDVIRTVPRAALFDHTRAFYAPCNLIVSAAGPVSHAHILDLAQRVFGSRPTGQKSRVMPARYSGGESRMEKTLEQTHILLGFQGPARPDPDYPSVQALAMILGGGMSSRLFQEVREKRGLVYSVYAHHAGYKDDGVFAVYAGTGPDKLPELMPVVCAELQKCTREISAAELERAKAQMRAGLLMGREQMMTRTDQQARQTLIFGRPLTVSEMRARIDGITIEGVQNMAARLLATKPTLATLGPVGQLAPYAAIEKDLKAA